MSILVFAFLIGIIAGLRTLMAPAMVSWAAGLGWLHLEGTHLEFLGEPVTRYILSVMAVGELIVDKLPKTPSRKTPPQFIARIVTGAFSGGALGAARHAMIAGAILGGLGAIAGTLGASELRMRLVQATSGRDWPIALLEDATAIVGGLLIVSQF